MGTIDRRHQTRYATVVEVADECTQFERLVLRIDPDVLVGDAPESPRGYAWHTLTTIHADPLVSAEVITAVLQQLRGEAGRGNLPSFRVIAGDCFTSPEPAPVGAAAPTRFSDP